MANYRYGVYYKYDGPTHSDPLRDELSLEEVERHLTLFPDELPEYFGDTPAIVEADRSPGGNFPLVVTVETEASRADADEAVKRCLNGLDLFGKKL